MTATVSALLVVHNEADQLAACLERLGFADQIVVVLDRCTDDSRAIAARFTADLHEGAWDVEGDRRNFGIAQCRGPWVFEVDADERVPPALAAEIRAVAASSTDDWHKIPVDNYIGSRLVRWGWGASFGKAAYIGLFRKGAKVWGPQRVHPKLELSGKPGPMLSARLDHYVDRNLSDMIQRLDRYTTARAIDLRASGDIGSYSANIRRIFSRFYKCYIYGRGYREGPYGFAIALCAALYPILSYLKARLETE
ncbi:MAG: glycosyltransferase family 2 protein [Azospirillaceae bacterium]|nr:glycosyltransferase family 2 protein [Azospirillaceae bacterium]